MRPEAQGKKERGTRREERKSATGLCILGILKNIGDHPVSKEKP